MKRISFLLVAALSATAPLVAQSYIPEYDNRDMKVSPKIPVVAYPFSIRDVQLLDGPFKEAMEADTRYLLEIEPDRLLSDYRVQSGLPVKAERYGGWEATRMRGPAVGFYLSACAMEYAVSRDRRFLEKVNYIVDELAACQTARRHAAGPGLIDMSGYVGAIPHEDTLWTEVSAGTIRSHGFDLNGAASPWYVVHKVMAGLLDAYYYCGNTRALQVEKGMADWTSTVIDHLSADILQKMLLCEYGGMNETLTNTYAVTGEKKYLDLSYKFYDKKILDSLSMGLDDLAGKHANTQVPKIIGSARRYELTADSRDRKIAEYFWSVVTGDYSYATGGSSDYEYFGAARKLNDELTDATTETCVTYNMLKLTRHLFAWHPSAALMDYYEKGLYNHILASQDHEDGMMCYYVSLRMGGHKVYSDRFNTFTCCVGTGMENHVKYGESIYSRGKDGSLYVNLFIPSRLSWKEKGLVIEQTTTLPADDKILLTVTASHPASFLLRIRKPQWAKQGAKVTINGVPQNNVRLGDDGYLQIERNWKNNDKISVAFPESFYTEQVPDNASRVALFYGPVLLAGVLGDKEPDPTKGIPVLVTQQQDPNKWVRKEDKDRLIFQTSSVGQPGDITLIPFNRTGKEFYSVYWDLFTPSAWTTEQKKYEEERKKTQELEDKTVDAFRVNEMQPERDHAFTGDSLHEGEDHGMKWRSTENGGYFSFAMKVDSAAAANALVCTYWGDEYHERERVFDIKIDGQTIATQDMSPFRQSKFYEVLYPIPAQLLKNKQTVIVKFEAHGRKGIGPVFGTIRMVRN
jgi:DUF1680 family protein